MNLINTFSVLALAASISMLGHANDFFGAVTDSNIHLKNTHDTRNWSVGGFMQQRFSDDMDTTLGLNGQWQPFSRLKLSLAGRLSNNGVPVLGEHLSYQFSEDDRNLREWQWQWRWQDSTVELDLATAWLRLGYQTVALGEAESTRIVDVISPKNDVWIGQADLDNSSLPVPAFAVDVPIDQGQLTLLGTYRAGLDRVAPAKTEVPIETSEPKSDFEVALWWQKSFSGKDVSVVLADVNQNQTHLTQTTFVLVNGQPVPTSMEAAQNRYQMLGATANRALGRWLFRTEAAYKHGVMVTPATEALLDPWPEENALQGMVGFEFNGPSGWLISTETTAQQTLKRENLTLGWAARAYWGGLTDLNERLTFQALATGMPENTIQFEHGLIRALASWNFNDGWNTELSGTWYFANQAKQKLYTFRHHDTISLSFRGTF